MGDGRGADGRGVAVIGPPVSGPTGRQAELLAALLATGLAPLPGSPPELRDLVHEAAHALDWGLPRPWSRGAVTVAGDQLSPGDRFASEVLARAVEGVVCATVGHPIVDLEHRALLAAIETIKFDGYRVPGGLRTWVDAIRHVQGSPRCTELVGRVLALTAP